ncbi:MAG: hypothetical protein WCK90_02655 [archaeon]
MVWFVNSSRGQMKIQEMAFVLVALMIFFAIVAVAYSSIRLTSLKESAADLRAQDANELARRLPAVAEFSYANCGNCIDFDKVLVLKDRKQYEGFWNLDYLRVEIISPVRSKRECTKANYPDCTDITLVNNSIGTPAIAYVAVCRQDFVKGLHERCELGRIYAGARAITTG